MNKQSKESERACCENKIWQDKKETVKTDVIKKEMKEIVISLFREVTMVFT